MAAVWTEDPTIGNALAGVASAAYGGPMLQLKTMEVMQGLRQRNLEMQRLQQQMQLSKSLGDQASGLFGGGDTGIIGASGPMIGQPGAPGSQASTGIGNIGQDQDQSSPSPSSGTQQPAGAIGQQRGQGNATLAPYYRTLMQLQAINGNTAGLQETMKEASLILGENFGATNPREAMALHQIYNDLKGPAANNFASQLQNHVEGGNQLTIPQAVFMGRWAGAQAPLTYQDLPNGERRLTRGALPVSPKMLTELQRNGMAPAGFEAPPGPSQQPPTTGQPPTGTAPPQTLPTGIAGGTAPLYYDQQQAKATAEDPLYQNALGQATTASQILTALSRGDRLSQLGALGAVTRMTMPTARTNPEMSQAQLEDLTSKWFQTKEEYEKWFKGNRTLPFELQQQIGNLAIAQSEAAKAAYENKYGSLRTLYHQRTGGDGSVAMPSVPSVNPNWMIPGHDYGQRGTATVPESAQPAPSITSRPPQGDILKELGIGER